MATAKQLSQKIAQKTAKRDRLKEQLATIEDPKSPKRKVLKDSIAAENQALAALKAQLKEAKTAVSA